MLEFLPMPPELAMAERVYYQLRDIEFEEQDPLPWWDREQRKAIPRWLRAEVWDWSQGRCFYCGTRLHPLADLHIDHAMPISRGGSTTLRNLVASCKTCNYAKRDRSVSEWRETGAQLWCDKQAERYEPYSKPLRVTGRG